jgi:hypothetical protein
MRRKTAVPTLRLKIREACDEPYVEFHVDGENLGARVHAAFGEFGADDVLPWRGGDYTIDETVLGEPARRSGLEGAILFACGCGYYACSGVFANVVVDGDALTIQEVFIWHGDKQIIAPLAPLTFDRAHATACWPHRVSRWTTDDLVRGHGAAADEPVVRVTSS